MNDDLNKPRGGSNWTSWDDNWATGLALILVGALFLLHTFNIITLAIYNWWAVFILIPGLNMAVKGWRRYSISGSRSDRSTGFWGLVLIAVAFAFIFGINWNYLFPAFLIGIGLYILLTK